MKSAHRLRSDGIDLKIPCLAPISEDRPSTAASVAVLGSQSRRADNGTTYTNTQLEASRFGLTADEKKNAVLTAKTLLVLATAVKSSQYLASVSSTLRTRELTELFDKSNPRKVLQIGNRTLLEEPNGGGAKIFKGASDLEVQQYFLELTGKTQLPEAIPLTIRDISGVRYTIDTNYGNFTLRSVSRSGGNSMWTIDVPEDFFGVAKEIKFIKGGS